MAQEGARASARDTISAILPHLYIYIYVYIYSMYICVYLPCGAIYIYVVESLLIPATNPQSEIFYAEKFYTFYAKSFTAKEFYSRSSLCHKPSTPDALYTRNVSTPAVLLHQKQNPYTPKACYTRKALCTNKFFHVSSSEFFKPDEPATFSFFDFSCFNWFLLYNSPNRFTCEGFLLHLNGRMATVGFAALHLLSFVSQSSSVRHMYWSHMAG